MKLLMIAPAVLAVTLVGGLATRARADECDKLTYLIFSAPIELPGVALPPGTYRFTHPGCAIGVLSVSSVDGLEVYGTFLTVPQARPTPTDTAEVLFAERPTGTPEAIEAWFYPGDTTGDGLIYPTPTGSPADTIGLHRSVPAKQITDQQFILDAAHANIAQLELGRATEMRTANDQVKKFAERMVADHQKALDDLKLVAQDQHLTLPTTLDAKDRDLKDRLDRLSGLALDRAYVKAMLVEHRRDVHEFNTEAASGKTDEVKQYAARTLPTLESHLRLARELERSIGPETGTVKSS